MFCLQSKKRGRPGGQKVLRQSASRESKPAIDYLLEQQQDDPRPYLQIRVFGKEILALLDSGASQTFLGEKGLWILEQFPAQLRDSSGRFVETADSTRHEIKGFVSLPITLKGKTTSLNVCVVPSLKQALILGIDFWESMHIVADIRNRQWDFASNRGKLLCSSIEGLTSEDNLKPEERRKLQELVEGHFKDEPQTLGRTDKVKHLIDTGDATPIKQRYYNVSPARQKLINEELDRMITLGVVEPSQSAWSSPIMLLDKPDGSKRFVVDFRAVNAVSKKDAYPLPQVTTILDRLRDAKYLSSLDIKSAYWQIELEESSKEKTAFAIPGRGLYQFVTMPFGLCGAPGTWQRFVDNVLGADLEPNVFVYLDDIIVVTSSFEKHLEVLSEIFKRIRAAKLTLNKEKCKFVRPELKYLGYIVSAAGLRVDPDKIKAIVDIPVPGTQKAVRQFTGMASWYRRFIPNFATRMHPLTSLLRRKSKFEWSAEAEQSFRDMKSCLVTAPILSCPDFAKPFTISCDASGVGIGAVLSQEYEQGEGVIAYASRTLSRQEQKFSATERECLSAIWAVEKFRPYVEGTKFTIITDHYSLLWLNKLKDPTGRLGRWALRLQAYDYRLVHRKGQENVVPDLLSRTSPPPPHEYGPIQPSEETQDNVPSSSSLNEDIHCDLIELPKDITDKWYTKMLEKVTKEPQAYPQWRVEDGILWKDIPDAELLQEEESWKMVIPKDLRNRTLAECHDKPTAGHQGVLKTYKRLQNNYYWPKMRKDVATYVSKCKTCQTTKYDQKPPAGVMGSRRGVDAPWKMIAADLMGPFPRSLKGFQYLLVMTDTFTKYSVLRPLRAATAKLVSQHLEEDIFLVYGVPDYLICDNGSEFIGSPVTDLARKYNIKVLLNARRHPQANPAERVNRDIITMLRAYVTDNHREWDTHIPRIGFALRTSHHGTTEHSPAFLNFGRELATAGAGFEVLPEGAIPSQDEGGRHVEHLRQLQDIYRDVTERLQRAHDQNAKRYNLRRRPVTYKVGDLVLKRNFPQSDAGKHFSAKLAPRYVGPYVIAQKISPLVYTLKDMDGKTIGNWHVQNIKHYIQ